MKRSLTLTAAVAAFVLPAAAPVLAQDQPLFRNRDDIRRARAADEARTAETPPPQPRQERPREERRSDRQDRREDRQERREDRRDDRQDRREQPRQPTGDQPIFRDRDDIRRAREADERRIRRENRDERRGDRDDRGDRPDNRDDRREWRQDRREDRREWRSDRREDRQEWRREWRQRFDRDQWRRDWGRRHDRGWWRNDSRWRGYSGLRVGFYFAPSYGYYQVPRSYWGQRWNEGDYLPSIFWRYQLNDWRTYGLGYPPEGTRWVLVDNHIYLIDEYDGYIIDVIHDAWRW